MTTEIASFDQLGDCRNRIRARFIADVQSRATAAGMSPSSYQVGGQYFENVSQRGLFGTAAALRVLGGVSETEARLATAGLVRYVRDRSEVELRSGRMTEAERGRWVHKLQRDHALTIRQSELLRGLTFVSGAAAQCDDLKTTVSQRLLNGRAHDGSGWGGRLDPPGGGSILATAHAVRALHRNGNDVREEIRSLKDGILSRASESNRSDETAQIDCFVGLVLHEVGVIRGRQARQVFDYLWSVLSSDLDHRREAMTEVFGSDSNDHVRVPWQLHLIALSARVRPWRRYLSPRVQRRIGEVVHHVLRPEGFQYGAAHGVQTATSLRTYAYIDDTISTILEERPESSADTMIARVLRTLERPISFARRVISSLLIGACLVLAAWSVISWVRSGEIASLAPDFMVAAVLGLLGIGVRLRRRS